jgi:hypothetical protein
MFVFGDRLNIGIQPLDKCGSVSQPVILVCGKRGVTITQRFAELCYNTPSGCGIERAC